MGGAEGQASDIAIAAKEILRVKKTLNEILAQHTGKSKTRIEQDSERDRFMTSLEAQKYGIIDKVVK